MRQACLPFSWQSLHAAVARADALLPVASWLSCGSCSSFACERADAASVSTSSQLDGSGEGCLPCFPPSRYRTLLVRHQYLLACLYADARYHALPLPQTASHSWRCHAHPSTDASTYCE